MHDEVFTIPARRCKRCGGLLTSSQGLRDGYRSLLPAEDKAGRGRPEDDGEPMQLI